MNKILLAIAALLSFVACTKKDSPSEIVTATINVIGEVREIEYTPMAKSDAEQYYLLVNVFVYDSSTSSYLFFARGVFSDLNNITINLLSGNKYKFCSCYVPKAVDEYEFYGEDLGSFKYGGYARSLYTGGYTIYPSYNVECHPSFVRYYGENEYEITSNQATISLDLKRCASRLCIRVKKLLVGSVKATIKFSDLSYAETKSRTITLTTSKPTGELIFSLSDATKCWNQDGYEEKYPVSFYYILGDSEQLIVTKELAFRRNMSTNIELTMNNSLSENGHYVAINIESDAYIDSETIGIDFSI